MNERQYEDVMWLVLVALTAVCQEAWHSRAPQTRALSEGATRT
jgi:hypothetical protein